MSNHVSEPISRNPMSQVLLRASVFVVALGLGGCGSTQQAAPSPSPSPASIGKLMEMDASFRDTVSPEARIEKIADGFTWSEGPAWMQDGGYLLFTDVPQNTLHRWKESEGLSVFLKPSGLANPDPRITREAGANG